ncbi:MAG: PhoU domain-containing protein [Thermoproteota archaeon]
MVWRRTIQKVGSGSFLVTLPKAWVRQNRVDESMSVTMIMGRDGSLIIMPEDTNRHLGDVAEIRISREGLRPQDALLGSYLLGYDAIVIRTDGEFSISDASEIRSVVRRLPGAEISEETLKHMEVRILLNPEMATPEKLVRRQSSLAASMISDCVRALLKWDQKLAERVMERDEEVDRQYFLLVRVIRSAFRSPELQAKMDMDFLKLMDLRMLVKYVEDSADQCVHVSREVKKVGKPPKIDLTGLSPVGENLSNIHLKSVELFNSFNHEMFRELFDKYREVENSLLSIGEKVEYKTRLINMTRVFNSLTKILENAKDIAELALTQAL